MIEVFLALSLIVIVVLGHQILVLKSKIKQLEEKAQPEMPGYSTFLEDSREAAFGYIEQVQLAIVDYREKTKSKNKAEIKESYNRLIGLLPEDM